MEPRFVSLLKRLSEKTVSGLVRWQQTANDESYRVGLGEGSVRIDQITDSDGDTYYRLTLLNKKAQEVEELIFAPWLSPEGDMSWAAALYSAARRSALDIDGLLASMEKDLEKGVTRAVADPTDDDLPF
jgi:hypothetical protein